jgi:glycolate oxidase
MDRSTLIDRLISICGEHGVFHTRSDLMVYEYDGSVDGSVETALPVAVTLPTRTEQVAEIVKVAKQAGLPITPRGAGTGLSGGAVTQEGGIIIALTRMDRILEIDREDRTALVEPGVINLELSETTTPLGMFFAPDPSSQRACTIGGNVAENSGGPHCLKYGVTSNHILGLEVVLPNGDVVWTGSAPTSTPGYDLTGAIVGSEGMFGIVTKALVRLTPNPESTLVQLAAFPDLDSASTAVSRIIAAGILPASLEMMDNLTIQAVEPVYHAGYPMDAGGVLLVETDGLNEEVAALGEQITAICRDSYATEVRSATEKAQRDLLWKGRKMALAAMGRLSPNYYLHDTVVPRSQLPATVARVREISTEFGIDIANVFHAGDGNLHPLMLFDRHKPGDMERVLSAGKEIIDWCVSVGGALSGEHGIGTEKRGYMTMVYTGEDLAAMAGLRNAFDPGGRLNPGKVFPKGYSCSEVRALRAQAMAQKHDIHPV